MSRELLSECQLDNRLLLASSEEGERAAKEERMAMDGRAEEASHLGRISRKHASVASGSAAPLDREPEAERSK